MKALLALSAASVLLATAAPSAFGDRFITDTLGGNGHPKQQPGAGFITDTLAPGGGPALLAPSTGGSSFDWGDAGIGAATAAGSLLVLMGGSLVTLRRRGRLAL